MSDFVNSFRTKQRDIYEIALSKGWYDGGERNLGEAIALMHSELSEALEALRASTPSDKIAGFSGVEEELADCIIRIMDISQSRGFRIAEALEAKVEYNRGRPYKHGKNF